MGVWAPRPRKDRAAISIMVPPTLRAAVTISTGSVLGSTWRRMIFQGGAPVKAAAWRNTSCFRDWTRPRESRAYWVQPVTDRAMTAFFMPAPKKPATAMHRMIPGKASRISTRRMTTASSTPPK